MPAVTRVEWAAAVPAGLPVAAVEVSTPFVARWQVRAGSPYPLDMVLRRSVNE